MDQQDNKIIVLILDEIDILFSNKKAANNLFYKLLRFPTVSPKSIKFALWGITNDLSIKNRFDTRVQSSLNPQEIYFPPFSALELQEILYQRSEAFQANVLKPGVVEFIAGHIAQNDGDSRRAIMILRTAGELAEQAEMKTVTIEYAKEAVRKFAEVKRQNLIQSLPKQSKLILQAIGNLQHKPLQSITGTVYKEYQRICRQYGIAAVGNRQFKNHLHKLEKLNLINTEFKYRGKKGNTRKITFYFS